jgi:hypothetical protein
MKELPSQVGFVQRTLMEFVEVVVAGAVIAPGTSRLGVASEYCRSRSKPLSVDPAVLLRYTAIQLVPVHRTYTTTGQQAAFQAYLSWKEQSNSKQRD